MTGVEVAGYVQRWRPSSVPPQAISFARSVVARAGPGTRARANALLRAAARLAAFGVPLGLEAVPEVLLHPSVIERFAVSAPGLSGSARRTLRANLRFLAREVVPALAPADAPLPRERAKAPYSPAEIAGYLALADAQPALSRRMRAAGLVCLGAGQLAEYPRPPHRGRGLRMKTSELKPGRTFAVAFEHGEDFMSSLARFCHDNGVRQGYIPMFLAGFAEADIVGTCEKLDNPAAPVWSKVHVSNVEALGCGTIARDTDGILPHIHTSVGLKEHSATAHTSHLLAAKVQFLTEMILVEIDAPEMTRLRDHDLYDVPLLRFG